jgi:prevent-host-death family protein
MGLRRIASAEFKAHCLQLMDDVQATRRPIVITKRGKPVAKLVPLDSEPPQLHGAMRGTIEIHGDIISPIDVAWEADA